MGEEGEEEYEQGSGVSAKRKWREKEERADKDLSQFCVLSSQMLVHRFFLDENVVMNFFLVLTSFYTHLLTLSPAYSHLSPISLLFPIH